MEKTTKYSIFAIAGLFLAFILLFGTYTTAKLNILLKGDLAIDIDPAQKMLLTKRGASESVTFNTSIENRRFCEATCDYAFMDLGKNETLDRETILAGSGTTLTKTYTLYAPEKGTGQLAYEFRVECANKPTFLCQSSGEKRLKSAFVTMGYELSVEEKLAIDNLKTSFSDFLESLAALDDAMQVTNGKIGYYSNYFPVEDLLESAALLGTEVDELINSSEKMKTMWQEEEFVLLNMTLSVEKDHLDKDLQYEDNLATTLNEKKGYHARVGKKLEASKIRFNQFNDIFKAYKIADNTDRFDIWNDSMTYYLSIINDFNNGTKNGDKNIEKEIAFFDKKVGTEYSLAQNLIAVVADEGITLIERYDNVTLEKPSKMNESFAAINETCKRLEGIAKSNETIAFLNKRCYVNDTLKVDLADYDLALRYPSDNLSITSNPRIDTRIIDHQSICCIFGECAICCQDTCAENPKLYPVILVHGHAASEATSQFYSLQGFESIREHLKADGYVDAGTILPTDDFSLAEKGALGRFGKPVVVGTTYYVDAYNHEGELVSLPSKAESIETYARRLNKTIELVRWKTGAQKVNIVAYSMGGLVAREYLLEYGEEKVDKLVMLATPNKGVSGKIESFCPVSGNRVECMQMSSESAFLNNLNNLLNKPEKVKTYTIAGKGCLMNGREGDGIVITENVGLPYSLNFEVEGNCETTDLHETIRDVSKYPKVYEIIRNALKQ